MQNIYIGGICSAIVVFFITALLLFAQRKNGERSRMMLSAMMLLSVVTYIGRLCYLSDAPLSTEILSIRNLLLGILTITVYFMYPIEVVSPGWLKWKRIILIFSPIALLGILYNVSLVCGVDFGVISNRQMLIDNIGSVGVITRIVLALLLFLPAMMLYLVPYTRRYNNTNHQWIRGYVIVIMINTLAYLFVLVADSLVIRTLYYVVSMACSMYIAYQELFVRLIHKSEEIEQTPDFIEENTNIPTEQIINNEDKNAYLFQKLTTYIIANAAWRNPDLSATTITHILGTNRTYLTQAIKENGYENYNSYINKYRIEEFIRIINERKSYNYKEAFFDAGFRSKSAAITCFKKVTGCTPSDYFEIFQEKE